MQKLIETANRISILDMTKTPLDSSMKKLVLTHFQRCCKGFYLPIVVPLKDPSITFHNSINSIRSAQSTYRELYPVAMVALADKSSNIQPTSNYTLAKIPKVCAYCKKKNHLRESCFLWLDTPDGSKWAAKNPQKAAKTRKMQKKLGV